jgi:RHS repeat-associated protein
MKTRLLKLVFYTAFSLVTARAFPQSAIPSPQITTATCGAAVCTWNAFGSKTYVRPVEQPREDGRHEEDGDDRASVFSDSFTIRNTATQYKLHITAEERIRTEVFLNGQRVVDEDDFEEHHQREDRANCHEADEGQCGSDSRINDPEIVTIDKVVHPTSSNVLAVRLHGRPGTHLTVSVIGVDNDPPSILETVAPLPNNFGWNNTDVELLFACSDPTSGIASCPNPVFLATAGLNQKVTGTAVDLAGNTSTASIQISVDKTPPNISIASPANNATVSTPAVQLTGTVTDALSGVASASCNGTAAVLQGSTFTCSLALTQGTNNITVSATDVAGNTASQSLSVNFLPISITNFNPTSAPVGTLVAVSGTSLTVNGSPQVVLNQQGGGTIAAPLVSASATGLSFVIPAGAATGPVTVRSGSLSAVSSAPLTIVAHSRFALNVGPASVNLLPGKSAAYAVSLASADGFSQLATLSISGVPSGVTASFSPAQITAGQFSNLTVTVPAGQAARSSALTISASATIDGILISQSANATLTVQAATPSLLGRTVESDTRETPLGGITITLLGKDDAGHTTVCTGQTVSDAAGNFSFTNLPAACIGRQLVAYNGNTATDGEKYASVNLAYTMTSGQVTGPELVHLPRIDNGETKMIQQNAAADQIFTFTTMPGVSVTIYAHTIFTLPDGTQPNPFPLTGVQVPVDRLPDTPIDGPGTLRAYIIAFQPADTTTNQPVAVTFPNTLNTAPGVNMELDTLDPVVGMLVKYGTGTVSADATTIVPDSDPNSPGHRFGIVHFDWHGPMVPAPNAVNPSPDPNTPEEGDPVDPASGLFVSTKTDIAFGGARGEVAIQRVYRTLSNTPGPFGLGTNHNYSYLLDFSATGAGGPITLLMPDGNRFPFFPQPDGTYTNSTIPSLLGAVITLSPSTAILRWKDKTAFSFSNQLTGFLNSIVDRNGNRTTFQRRGPRAIQITQIVDPVGRVLDLTYDAFDRITSMTDPIGRVVEYTYNSQGTLASVIDAAGGVTTYTYDANNRVASITDPRGITYLQNTYDANGKVIRQADANNAATTFSYTLLNPHLATSGNINTSPVVMTVVTDPLGNQTTYHFNPQGFLIDTTDALGERTIYTRDPQTNLLLGVTDSLNRTSVFTYDSAGNMTSSTLLAGTPNASTMSFTYNPIFNNIASITNPLSQTTSLSYDAAGNITSLVDPLNHQTSFSYDNSGELLSTSDALGNTVQLAYSNGSLASSTDPSGNTTTRISDPAGRLVTSISPSGQKSIYSYDALNQITQVTDSMGNTTILAYDPNGNLLNVTDPLGRSTTFSYDPMDRPSGRTDPLLRQETSQYDLNGNLVRFTDRKGNITTLKYDSLNRLIFSGFGTNGNSYESTLFYNYDAASRVSSLVDSAAGTVTESYDDLDRRSSEITALGSVNYTYDAAGRKTSRTVVGQPAALYTYDNANRLIRITQSSATVQFTYDDADRRSSLTLPNGVTVTYSYDHNSRPAGITYQSGGTNLGSLTYSYDVLGRRTQVGGSLARTAMPQPVSSAVYSAANELLNWNGIALSYDSSGNILSDGANTFGWNARNQAVQINGINLQYDAFGRRTRNAAGKSFLYDGPNAVQELFGTTVSANMLTGGVDEILSRTDSTGSFTPLEDALGSTIGLVGASGTIQTSYTFDPFGVTTTSGQSNTNSFQYTSRENEGNGLYYYRARYYNPVLGRFISQDPRTSVADINAYIYTLDSPTNFTDPFGLRPLTNCEKEKLGPYIPKTDLDKADIREKWPPKAFKFLPIPLLPKEVEALTIGNTIFMRPGRYDPAIVKGLALLGHELFHVGQFRTKVLTKAKYIDELLKHGAGPENKYEAPAWDKEAAIQKGLGGGDKGGKSGNKSGGCPKP